MPPQNGMPREAGLAVIGASSGVVRVGVNPLAGLSWPPRSVLMAVALLVAWALCNPFFEIDHSSLIYSGRMLAELDPAGVGRDAMYRYDGQSAFTLFTRLNTWLVGGFGLASATLAISIASVVFGFIGAATFTTAIAQGRTRVLSIIYAAALPACYGGYKLFSFAETAATPRPFAEAFVLCGVAALVRGRIAWALAAMICATVLHPILALPGIALLALWRVVDDKRWLIPIAVLVAIIIGAAALHLPLFDRLIAEIDPTWKTILEGRNPHLFPSLWPDGWKGRGAARIATLLVAASLTKGPVRRAFLLTLAVGLCGFCLAYVLNERTPIVLLVQAQTWRATWLMFAIAPMAGAICTVRLWPLGGARRVVLALLVLSWIFADHDQVALMLAGAALAFHFCVDPAHTVLSKQSTFAFVAIAALLAIGGLILNEWQIVRMTLDAPAGYAEEARRILALDWDYTPLAIVAAIVIVWTRDVSTTVIATLTLVGALLLVVTWDRRSVQTRDFDAGLGMPDLALVIEARPGEVFWLGGVQESWRWLGRPNWVSPIQGAGLVFSRPLAMLYQDRAQRAAQAGLDDGSLLTPNDDGRAARQAFDESKLKTFCAAPDAPAWIVSPLVGGFGLPDALKPIRRTLGRPVLTVDQADDGALHWRWISQIEVAACAGVSSS